MSSTSKSWKSILVAVGSPASRSQIGIGKAAEIARRCKAHITLFHVFASPVATATASNFSSEDVLRQVSGEWKKQLLRLAAPLRATGLKVDCAVEWDFPSYEGIVRYALKTQPDLLIAESHHHGRIARWILTNTDWELIRSCPCPLWFVKSAVLPVQPVVLAAVDPFHANAKPAALDGQIISTAIRMKKQLGAQVALAHACDVPSSYVAIGPLDTVPAPPSPDLIREFEIRARRELARLAGKHGIGSEDQIVAVGAPAAVIEGLVKKRKVDVVVMGAVSRRGLNRVFIGSTAERLIDQIRCDVLILKPTQFKTSVPRRRTVLPF